MDRAIIGKNDATGPKRAGAGYRPMHSHLRCCRRFLSVALHVFYGVSLTLFSFNNLSALKRRQIIRDWSGRLLELLRVRVQIKKVAPHDVPPNTLLVANHISWLDVFVLNSFLPSRFVAKSNIRKWPIVGQLVAGCGTLFIDREVRRDTARVNTAIAAALDDGDYVAIFPEGTTSSGVETLPFYGSLLQPIIMTEGSVQPIAIRYRDRHGAQSFAPVYIGDTSLLRSIWWILRAGELNVEVMLTAALSAEGKHRRQLALEARALIDQALDRSLIGSAPDRSDRPPALTQ